MIPGLVVEEVPRGPSFKWRSVKDVPQNTPKLTRIVVGRSIVGNPNNLTLDAIVFPNAMVPWLWAWMALATMRLFGNPEPMRLDSIALINRRIRQTKPPPVKARVDGARSGVSTTMIYTHVRQKPGIGVRSPLDA
jgi:hypothetical protein